MRKRRIRELQFRFMKKAKISKLEIIIIALVVFIGVALLVINKFIIDEGKRVRVKIDGQVIKTLDLNENQTFNIYGDNGTNTLIISNGKAYVKDADCPDKICVSQGKISKEGQSIICLPHKVVIEIDGNEKEIDGIAK